MKDLATKADVRRAILDATLAMIGEKGLDKVSWRGIARSVGYSPAGLYEYYDNKDHIIASLVAEGLALLDDAMARADVSSSLEARLAAMGRAYVRFAHEHPDHFQLAFSVLPSGRRSLGQSATGAFERVLDAVRVGIESGAFETRDDLDAEAIAYGFWSLAHGLASLQVTALRGFDAAFEVVDAAVMKAFLRGLRP